MIWLYFLWALDKKNKIPIIILGITLVFVLTGSSMSVSFASFTGSPNFQLESGVAPEDVVCNTDHIFILRDNYSPICVTVDSAKKLVDRLDWILLKSLPSQKNSEDTPPPFERGPAPRLLKSFGDPISSSEIISFAQDTSTWSPFVLATEIPVELELKAVYSKSSQNNEVQSTRNFFLPVDVVFDENFTLPDLYQNGGIYMIVQNRIISGIDVNFEEKIFVDTDLTYKQQSGFEILIRDTGNSQLVEIMNDSTYVKLLSTTRTVDELESLGLSIFPKP